MKKYLIILSLLLVAEVGLTAVPLNFTPRDATGGNGARLLEVLKKSYENPVYLFESYVNPAVDHNNKIFTARVLTRLNGASISPYEQKLIRNEICASYKLFTGAANPFAGSFGIYKYNNSIVAVTDNALAGKPLSVVLRELSNLPTLSKQFIAKYYAVDMIKVIASIDSKNLIWNNLDLHHFYVKPNGRLYAYDFSQAIFDPATRVQDKQDQINKLVLEVWPHMYSLLFPYPNDAKLAYQTLITSQTGTGAVIANNIDAARTTNWTLDNLKAITVTQLGVGAYNTNPSQAFGGAINGAAMGNTATVITAFNNNSENFLNRENHKPWTKQTKTNIAFADHTSTQNNPANAAFLGDNGFALDDAVRLLITAPNAGNPFSRLDGALAGVDASSMCLNWTGRE